MQRVPGNVRRREAFSGPADLARFFRGDRLETMPRRAKDRAALLEYVASLRRYLIDAGLLTRDRGVYRRR